MTRVRFASFVIGFIVFCAARTEAAEPKRVLMLHAYDYSFPATTLIGEAARREFAGQSLKEIELSTEFLDLARNADPGYETALAAFVQKKYARNPPDVIMTLGSAAMPFALRHRQSIAPEAPIVFTAISPQTYAASNAPADVTGVITTFDLDRTLRLATLLQPDARRLYFVAGSGQTDARWQDVARRMAARLEPRFTTTFLFGLPYSELVARLKQVPPDAIVIVLTVFADPEGKTFVPAEIAGELAAISPAPVYAPYDTYIGRGVVGGFVESFQSVGRAAADMTLEILARPEKAGVPPPRTNPGQTYRVDQRAMERWQLRTSDLPSGTELLFRKQSLWEEHSGAVVAAALTFLVQSLFLTALLLQRRKMSHTEGMLRESDERMTFAAASANIGLWKFNRATGKFWATDHCIGMLGLPAHELLSRETFLSCLHPDDRERARASLEGLANGERMAVSDLRAVRLDGETRWLRMHSRVSSTSRDGSVGGILIDVTELRSAEMEAEVQRSHVAHLMRVSLLGGLSGSIAHEINQPLTAILANAQAALFMLRQARPDLPEIRAALEEIVEGDRRATDVIQRLRLLLRNGERRTEEVDVGKLIASTLALLKGELISRDARVNFRPEPSGALVRGDAVQLQQVMLNLVMNALDAMVALPAATRDIVVTADVVDQSRIVVQVRDRGPGLPSKTNGRLFEPFYTTKEHGLGLGLTICSTIIKAHGGELTLENGEEGGAVACFTLPAIAGERRAA